MLDIFGPSIGTRTKYFVTDRVERELAAKISIRSTSQSQSTNHMSKVVGKNPVASLDIQYSVFFLWETKKSLQSKLSFPISTCCQLVNKSIKTSRRIVQCERLETRLKKESSRITAKYRTLKGQHRTLFKTKTINVLIFEGELSDHESPPPAKLQISGVCVCVCVYVCACVCVWVHVCTYACAMRMC